LKEKTSRITDRDALLAIQAKHAEESEAKETRFKDAMLLTQKQITDAIDSQTKVIKDNNEAVIRTLEKLRP